MARGARDGGALIEGILPDDERTVSDLLSTATPGAVQALRAASREADSPRATANAELPPIVLGRIWPTRSAPRSAIRSCSSARRAS